MPMRDGKGPDGLGPLSGACQGNCIVPIDTPESELVYLLNRQKALKKELDVTEKRIVKVRQKIVPLPK
jgi:hypothetical protein